MEILCGIGKRIIMLLNEIIDLKTVHQISKSEDDVEDYDVSHLGPRIGEGLFADVFNGHHPNTVIKIAGMKNLNDAYLKFLEIVVDNQDNPFFPRIYSAEIYDTSYKYEYFAHTLVVEMERLVPLNIAKTEDLIEPLFKQMGFKIDVDTKRQRSRYFANVIDKLNSVTGRAELRAKTKNPMFEEALKALDALFKDHMVDTHEDNWMLRLTKHGPHIVITDPVVG